ncbi:hypothetical protein MMC19_007178 [Ptychographa xylographoides]|nr:hypothetical protein [Ptychographa xylographoides]
MSSSPSASDIISYIGIPLAVLGVLPIIYTCLRSIFTLSRIRASLRHNNLAGVTRGSLMSGVIEVELPRCAITPVDRDDPLYWARNPQPSHLKGGTWTLFYWNRILTGRKLYRLQYSEDLQEPQAEIDFEELLGFLLDRGAVPDGKGIHMLRLAGLWTPTGTSLLLSPDGSHSVLKISVPDDSDGVLSLVLQWRPEWDDGDGDALQPGWVRVEDYRETPDEVEEQQEQKRQPVGGNAKEKEAFPSTSSADAQELAAATPKPLALRFHIGVRAGNPTIDAAMWDLTTPSSGSLDSKSAYPPPYLPTAHIPLSHLESPSASTWLPAFAIALAHLHARPPWTTHIPAALLALATRSSVPAGVLVLLDLIPESDAPACFTSYDKFEEANAMGAKMRARQQKMMAETRLPAAQQAAARMLRESEERSGVHEEFMARQRRDRERKEKRDMEALVSARVDDHAVAVAALGWLRKQGDGPGQSGFAACVDLRMAAEKMMYACLVEEGRCEAVCGMLERWRGWVERGGMNREDLAAVRADVRGFCWAGVLMGVLGLAGGREESVVAVDMQECVRVWKKVRLG